MVFKETPTCASYFSEGWSEAAVDLKSPIDFIDPVDAPLGLPQFSSPSAGLRFFQLKAQQSAPSVFPLISCCSSDPEELQGSVIFGCLAAGYSPGHAEITWEPSNSSRIKTFPEVGPKGSNGHFWRSSQYTVPSADFETTPFTCIVKHPGDKKPNGERKLIERKTCYKSMQTPTVSITKPSYRDLVEGTATVTCLVEGSSLEKIQITWNVDGRPSTQPQAEMVKTDAGGHQNANSSHTISLDQWKKGTTFRCNVATMCLEEITKDVTIKEDSKPTTKPLIRITQTYRDVSSNSNIAQILVCEVSGFSPMEISISWKKNSIPLGKALYDNGPVLPSRNAYMTYSILRIGRTEIGDGRDSYACVVHHPSSPTPITAIKEAFPGGEGTNVTVRVETIPPSFLDIFLTKSATLTCRISNIPFGQDPAELNVTWMRQRDNKPLDTRIGQPKEQENRELVFVDAMATIGTEEWDSGDNFQCKVSFPLLASTETKSLKKEDGGSLSPPSVYVLPPLSEQLASQEKATITCLAKDFFPGNCFMLWLRNGEPVGNSEYYTSDSVLESKSPKLYFASSTLNVKEQEWNGGDTYTCVVGHEALPLQTTQKTIDKNTGVERTNVTVHVETIPPSFRDVFLTKSAKLTCRISNIPFGQDPAELNVTWMRQRDNKPLDTVIGQPKEQENKELVFVEATAAICAEEWDSGDNFQCKVSFPLFARIAIKSLKKEDGGSRNPPSVYVLPPPPEQLASREMATVTCLAKGFFPNSFFVQWMQNDEPVGDSEYYTSDPVQESKSPERYSAFSILNVKEQEWNGGDTYTCVVGHEALPLQTTQKTIDKHMAYLDGIVDIDDDEGLLNVSSILSTFIILFLVSLFYGATVTVIKVK